MKKYISNFNKSITNLAICTAQNSVNKNCLNGLYGPFIPDKSKGYSDT